MRIRYLATTAILSSVLAVAAAPALAATKPHHKHRPAQAEPVSNASAVSPAKNERSAPARRAGSTTGADSSAALLAANKAAIATYESQITPVANRRAVYLRVDCSGAATLLTCTGEWYPGGATGAPARLAPLQYTYSNGRVSAVPQ